MLESKVDALTSIIRNEDLKKYTGDSSINLVRAFLQGDLISGGIAIYDAIKAGCSLPDIILFDKLSRYLSGAFLSVGDQQKLAEKFDSSNEDFKEFTKNRFTLSTQ